MPLDELRPIDDWWWPTPDTISETLICKQMLIPENLLPEIYGALAELLDRWNWNTEGAIQAAQMPSVLLPIISAFAGSDCETEPIEPENELLTLVSPYVGYWWI